MPSSGRLAAVARHLRHPRRSARLAADATRLLLGVAQPQVLVLGNQKSGTTAIAALLAQRLGVRATLDIPALWGDDLERRRAGAGSLRWLAVRHPHAFTAAVVKEPNLTFRYEQARAVFPHSRVVFVVREPRANIRSILSRLGLPGDADELTAAQRAVVPAVWRAVLDPELLGLAPGTYIETLARRWSAAADIYLRHAGDLTLVRYEDFVRDKAAVITTIANALGLAVRHDIAASIDRQFQPLGSRAPYEQFFGERNLARIAAIARRPAAQLGYPPPGS
jgi:Sulfotransferase family